MVDIVLLKEFIVLAGTSMAAYTDYRTGLIFDEITYPMIVLGIIFSLAELNLSAFLTGAIVFAAGYLLYVSGKTGGGDVKLFLGITLLLPELNNTIFILNALVISGFSAVIALSVYYLARYAKKGIKLSENTKSAKKAAMFFPVILAYFYIVISSGLFSPKFLAILAIVTVPALAFIALENGVKKNFFLKKIPLKGLEEDDLIAAEFLDKKTAKELSLNFMGIIDKKVKQKLVALKIKTVPVYRNLPKFAPFVLLGVIIAMLFPDIFAWTLS